MHKIIIGFIKDIDIYLISFSDSVDFSLNMSKMSEDELQSETTKWLARLNKTFGTGLDSKKLLKTGGEDEHSTHQEKIDKNQTTTDWWS